MEVKKLHYKLSSRKKPGDLISYYIYKRRRKIFYNIKNFAAQPENNGVFAENILRLILDGVNLNHISKNHPHVDIAIKNAVPGIVKSDEVISVKSSTRTRPTLASVISDSKAIKLESMFSYILYANSNYGLDYQTKYFKPKQLLKQGIDVASKGNGAYREVVNLILYYVMYKNAETYKTDFENDLATLTTTPDKIDENIKLTHGVYGAYRFRVLRRIALLENPISLGVVYLEGRDTDLTCVIKKTNDIKVSRYWEDLISIWLDEDYFSSSATKYLREDKVKELFKISSVDDFPIEIKISIDTFEPKEESTEGMTDVEKREAEKTKTRIRSDKLYVATKFKDADFDTREDDVNSYFLRAIDLLEQKPRLITKFNQFIDSL